jgi:hypothetical protein
MCGAYPKTYASPVPKEYNISSTKDHNETADLQLIDKYLQVTLYFANKKSYIWL